MTQIHHFKKCANVSKDWKSFSETKNNHQHWKVLSLTDRGRCEKGKRETGKQREKETRRQAGNEWGRHFTNLNAQIWVQKMLFYFINKTVPNSTKGKELEVAPNFYTVWYMPGVARLFCLRAKFKGQIGPRAAKNYILIIFLIFKPKKRSIKGVFIKNDAKNYI